MRAIGALLIDCAKASGARGAWAMELAERFGKVAEGEWIGVFCNEAGGASYRVFDLKDQNEQGASIGTGSEPWELLIPSLAAHLAQSDREMSEVLVLSAPDPMPGFTSEGDAMMNCVKSLIRLPELKLLRVVANANLRHERVLKTYPNGRQIELLCVADFSAELRSKEEAAVLGAVAQVSSARNPLPRV